MSKRIPFSCLKYIQVVIKSLKKKPVIKIPKLSFLICKRQNSLLTHAVPLLHKIKIILNCCFYNSVKNLFWDASRSLELLIIKLRIAAKVFLDYFAFALFEFALDACALIRHRPVGGLASSFIHRLKITEGV